jgi:hypothetical protein
MTLNKDLDHIKKETILSFSHPILLRGRRTRLLRDYAISLQKSSKKKNQGIDSPIISKGRILILAKN